MEFATIFVGIIGIWFFGQTFWMATLAIVLGTALGSLSMGVLAARGPLFGVPQMVLSRIGFGFLGNILPAGINSRRRGRRLVRGQQRQRRVRAQRAARLEQQALPGDHRGAADRRRVLRAQPRAHLRAVAFPFLVVVFLIASVVIVSEGEPGAPARTGFPGGIGGFLVTLGAAFGYAAGWNPFASDYTRYLPPTTNRRATGLWAGLGVFVSCVLLETVGAAAATVTSSSKFGNNPTAGFTSHLATPLADVTLLAIALGAVCANALNVYSGSMSFLALGDQAAAGAAAGHRRARVRRRRLLPRAVRPARRG